MADVRVIELTDPSQLSEALAKLARAGQGPTKVVNLAEVGAKFREAGYTPEDACAYIGALRLLSAIDTEFMERLAHLAQGHDVLSAVKLGVATWTFLADALDNLQKACKRSGQDLADPFKPEAIEQNLRAAEAEVARIEALHARDADIRAQADSGT